MKYLGGLLLSLLIYTHTWGQTKFTLNGYVRDKESGEALIGATVREPVQGLGAQTNEFGFFSLRLLAGNYKIIVHSIGYEVDTVPFDFNKDYLNYKFDLKPEGVQLQAVEISAEAKNANVTSMEMSNVKIDVQEIKQMPALFGETDILRTFQLMPGVKSAGDGNSSIFVRGGNYDQNLILLDDATVYNASHFLGFFSVFNSDAIKDANLMKGGIPAPFGGRLSSVLALRMKEGNFKKYHVAGGIGLLSARLMVEGPIVKEKGSFIVTGRRTFTDLLIKMHPDKAVRNNKLYFWDANAKVNYSFSEKDKIYASFYSGKDVFGLADEYKLSWGNIAASMRWNHLFSPRLFCNTTVLFSDFFYDVYLGQVGIQTNYSSGIRDGSLKLDFDYYMNPKSHWKFGMQSTYQRFIVGDVVPNDTSSSAVEMKTPRRHALNWNLYISNEHIISKHFTLQYGLRYAIFHQIGPGDIYSFPNIEAQNPTDTTHYAPGKLMKTYHGPEPRIAVNYTINSKNAIKASYNRTQQFIHVASNSNAGLPIDLWLPSTYVLPPQRADQIALGYFRNFKENMFETSVEVYYKRLYNQIDFRNDARIIANPFVEYEFIFGRGDAFGAEFFVKKSQGKLTGWISYTLSWSLRKFDKPNQTINNGDYMYARNDRRHDLAIVLTYTLNKKWSFTGSWVYGSGLPITLPSTKYMLDNQIVGLYEGRNQYRMPATHRLDLSINFTGKQTRKWKSSWNLSVYNVYARKNPWAIRLHPGDDGKTQNAYLVYLFTIIPSITYNFEF